MPQSLAQVYLHIVFSTKHREAFLTDRELRSRLHAYLAGICRNHDSPPVVVGGVEDHVHLLIRLSRTCTIADLIREMKRESSGWIKRERADLSRFAWQAGYGAFSVSPAHVPALVQYIQDQEAHHRKETFQEEFRRLLKKYGVEFDERYVWE